MPLSDAQIDRYSRQIILPEVGGRGQERLLAARVALRGVGAMAATAARYLTGAGIGELRLSATSRRSRTSCAISIPT
jgi:adenylyltransferase/sulfurtransferase